jgi:hypothetical protein
MIFVAGGEQEQSNYGTSSQSHEVTPRLVGEEAVAIAHNGY